MSRTPQPEPSEQTSRTAAPAAEACPAELMNPKLSANLRADYEALRNDVQQANEMAAHFQMQLAGKSNEFALLKQVFEKTCEDLLHLQAGINALREERHRLANEAMRTTALEMKLANVTGERDRLRLEVQVIRDALASLAEDSTRATLQQDAKIAELTIRVVTLKEALAGTQRAPEPARKMKTASAERLYQPETSVTSSDDFIDISFEA